ncbi:Flp pilus assembly complex ATPase component TadA [Candidatus Peregrinibacteria bacterium]|jgi:twitching motility protein PilT|nr:Flp pilus assembly complex ATPase component TadA [Candidatus Peregrinibacteria bacterium]
MLQLKQILKYQKENNLSDIHLITEELPFTRNHKGELTSFSEEVVTKEAMESLLKELCDNNELESLKKNGTLDKATVDESIGRFRVNIFHERRGYGINIRIISNEPMNVSELKISSSIFTHVLGRSGLILVSGPNNSGKTTMVNSFIDLINEKKKVKIITFEDPIEYIHKRKQAIISQHDIQHEDKSRLREDLKSVFRQDADVVFIGEIRGADMMEIAMEMAETGYLVFATIHATDTIQTVERIASMFPAEKHTELYKQLAAQLKVVICQHLIPNKTHKLIPCRERMIVNDGIRNLIAHGNFDELGQQLETSSSGGNILFDQHLIQLYQNGEITKDTVFEYNHDRSFVSQIMD